MSETRLSILLMENDLGFARYAGEMLGQARDVGAEVVIQPDFMGGLEALAGREFNIVFMSLALPDGAGLANVSLVRALAPHVPIILGGEADDEMVAVEAVHAGAQDYLVKGQLTPAWLERSIRYAIERQGMDLALVEAEEKYHSIFDHLVEGIFQTTPRGQYLMANASLAQILGYASPEEMVRSQTDIGRRVYVEEGRREEFIRLMQEHDTLEGFESPVYRKDGSVIWISESCRAVRDRRGRLLYYEGTVVDITQRRQAEEKLRHSETLYHSLVENLPQFIFRKDIQGRFTFANQQFCRVLGRPLEEIVGKNDYDFFPPELAAKYQKDDQQVILSGTPYETVEDHQPPGKKRIYVQVVKTPLRGPDEKIIGLQGIFWDITAQRLAEQRIRKANALLAKSRKELRARNAQMEEDLKMAREIQLTMLPQQYPVFPRSGPGSESVFRFSHRYIPSGTVGGDFFAVSALSETQAAVFLCDVAGHGARSALVAAMIRALLEELQPVAAAPGELLSKLNSDLCAILRHTGSPLLTTAFYLVADWRSGWMQYANAGHPKPLHLRRRAGQVAPLANASGKAQPALGLLEGTAYVSSQAPLEPQDTVLLFTDGLVEVQNADGELYTEALLQNAIRERLAMPVSELFDDLLAQVRAFSGASAFNDDVCLVGLERGD